MRQFKLLTGCTIYNFKTGKYEIVKKPIITDLGVQKHVGHYRFRIDDYLHSIVLSNNRGKYEWVSPEKGGDDGLSE